MQKKIKQWLSGFGIALNLVAITFSLICQIAVYFDMYMFKIHDHNRNFLFLVFLLICELINVFLVITEIPRLLKAYREGEK